MQGGGNRSDVERYFIPPDSLASSESDPGKREEECGNVPKVEDPSCMQVNFNVTSPRPLELLNWSQRMHLVVHLRW